MTGCLVIKRFLLNLSIIFCSQLHVYQDTVENTVKVYVAQIFAETQFIIQIILEKFSVDIFAISIKFSTRSSFHKC